MSVVKSGRLSLSNPLVPVVLLAALVAGFLIAQRDEKSMAQPQILGLLWPNPKPLTQFELNSTSAHPFTLETLKDRWPLLFFGYTSCPDVCPTTLATLSGVMQRLRAESKADRLQVVFVSVDPQRDTLDQIARYIGYFDSSFMGATASPERWRAFRTNRLVPWRAPLPATVAASWRSRWYMWAYLPGGSRSDRRHASATPSGTP